MMTIRDFVRREGVLDPAVLTTDVWTALDDVLAEAAQDSEEIVALMPQEIVDLPCEAIHALTGACIRFLAWKQVRGEFLARRDEEGLPDLPDAAVDDTVDAAGLAALERAARFLLAERYPGGDSFATALKAALALWTQAIDLARQYGKVRATALRPPAVDSSGEPADESPGVTEGFEPIASLTAPRWLVMSEERKNENLELDFEIPEEPLSGLVQATALALRLARRPAAPEGAQADAETGPPPAESEAASDASESGDETAKSVLAAALVLDPMDDARELAKVPELLDEAEVTEEEVAHARQLCEALLPSLEQALIDRLDEVAGRRTAEAAVRAYGALLSAPPLNAPLVGAVYIGTEGRIAIGLAVVERDGSVMSTARIAPTEGWTDRVKAWLRAEDVRHIVLPSFSEAEAELALLRQALAGRRTIVSIRPTAYEGARDALLEGRKKMTREAASAAALAMRAVRPFQAWRQVDPVLLELTEGHKLLPQDELRRELELLQFIFDHRARLQEARFSAGQAAAGEKFDHPPIRTMTDLKPGMVVPAVVTNITRFGAFADLGLSHQGLIHISDLADHFVRDPSEVVRTGQQVRARVLSVDIGRGRISLSLRSDNPRPQSRPRTGSRPPAGGDSPGSSGSPRMGSTTGDRQRALRDLQRLFDR